MITIEENKWSNIPENIEEYYGFIYLITNLKNNRKYIGKKFFKTPITRQPLKGKKRKRHSFKESDWQTYWGSSPQLLNDISEIGKDNFKREIIKCCKTKWECAYYEAYYQFKNEVLFCEDYYNGIINIRLPKAPKELRK
jgi:hypothetical protein